MSEQELIYLYDRWRFGGEVPIEHDGRMWIFGVGAESVFEKTRDAELRYVPNTYIAAVSMPIATPTAPDTPAQS